MIAFLLKLYSSVLFVCVRGTKQSVATFKWFLALCKRMNMLLFFDLSCQNNFLIKLRNSEWLFRLFTYTGNELFVYSLNYKTKGTKRVHLANRNEENNEKELSTPQMYVIQAAVIVWCAIKFNLRRKKLIQSTIVDYRVPFFATSIRLDFECTRQSVSFIAI